jgi:hypothetical protein
MCVQQEGRGAGCSSELQLVESRGRGRKGKDSGLVGQGKTYVLKRTELRSGGLGV